MTVVSDRIGRAFNRSWATRAVALDTHTAFDRVWYAGHLHKLKSYGISDQIFGLISSFLSNRRFFWVFLDRRSSQEYPVNMLAFLKAPFLVLHFSYLHYLPDNVICNIVSMLMILLFTLRGRSHSTYEPRGAGRVHAKAHVCVRSRGEGWR